jgi:hypothetical protein
MDGSHDDFANVPATAAGTAPTAQPLDLTAFLKFPSLSRLFQSPASNDLAKMRAQLRQTNERLERVVRQGTKEEADRALLVSRSYTLTLALLDELEQHLTPAK